MEHQRWDPVVLRRKVVPLHVTPPEVPREVKIDREEIGTHEKVTMSLAKTIQQARIARATRLKRIWPTPWVSRWISSMGMNPGRVSQTTLCYRNSDACWE